MDMATALADLGVSAGSIDGEMRSRLDRDGYAPLPGVLSAAQLAVIQARLGELLAAEGDRAGLEVHQEEGTDRLANLVNKDPAFEVCFTDPRLLACVAHVLGEFKLSSLNFRAALPGQGLQVLHAEGGPVTDPAGFQVCNSIWLLDDFTADNGATRVVPGSHLSGRSPSDVLADRHDSHPGEVLLLAPGRDRRRLQQPPVARRHPEPLVPSSPRAARLLHPARQRSATRPAEVRAAGNPGPPRPGGPVHTRRLASLQWPETAVPGGRHRPAYPRSP